MTKQEMFRYSILIVLGVLIAMASAKFWHDFQYNACHQAVYDILFLKK